MFPLPFLPYEGGPTIIEWLNQICQKFNELLTAVKNVRELPPGGTHGQVATPKEDGSGYEWVNQSGGGGGGSDDLWYPTVTTAGIISWAKSSTTTPPASRNIKGPKGNDGTPGTPGKDGVSPTANVVQTETGATITVTDASGTTTAKIKNGTPGKDGAPGAPGAPGTPGVPGKDGITPTFEVGTVTKLSPDAEPTVTLEDVGGGLYMIDYGIPQGQPGTPGSGSGDVVAAGNNVFTGTNHFEGLTVLGETHAETPNNNNDVTNKLYVDTLAGTTKTSAVTEADEHTDNKISALRTLPAGGTSGQVPTIASDGESVEWKTPSGGGGGGGGSDDLWYPTVTTAGIISWAKSSTTTPPASRNIKGPKGNDGTPGTPGKDGVSPTANVVQTETGATITVTDASGTTTAKIKNGTPGKDGAPGAPGAPGTPGVPGKDGITPTFEVGTVTKLSPDAEPTVTLEDVGGGLYMIDYGIPQGQPGTPGSGSGDVVAAGNNVFTGTNHFEGLTVLGETHAETPNNNNDVTNKLYVDTLAGTTKTSAVTEADEHTDNKISALRTLPAGGTSGQVPTIASDGESVEWKTPSGGGGGGGVEWVEVTPSQVGNTNIKIDKLKLWYDKNDHQHLKFEGYIWATAASNAKLSIIMPNDFSPVVSDMWVPLVALAGTNISVLTALSLYVQYNSEHRLTIFPSGSGTYWLVNRRYAVGSEIYLNPSQLIQSNSDEVNDEIGTHTGDGAETQHGE